MATSPSANASVQLQILSGDGPKDNLGNEPAHLPPSLSSAKVEDENPQSNITETKQQWNRPPRNMWKVFAAFICFSIVGANDGAYGVMLCPRSTSYFDLR